MKKLYTLFVLILTILSNAQDLTQYNIAPPNLFTSLEGIVGIKEKTIIYGAVPPNSNGKVLVFVHGFIADSSSLLVGNDFYKNAYSEGYKVAFVSMTRFEGDWENGKILAKAIDMVTQKYNVPTLTIIAHSNGGKATDVAMLEYEKSNKVNKVITLGTPHRGTEIADLVVSPSWSWLSNLTPIAPGAALSTTYYCDNFFRPYMDNHYLNNPSKIYSYGAWGGSRIFKIGSSICIPGYNAIQYVGGGENDGVTPYLRSKRPGGTQLSNLEDSKGNFNHLEIMYGQNTWNEIVKPVLDGAISVATGNSNKAQDNIRLKSGDYTISSNYQLIFKNNETTSIIHSKKASIVIFSEIPTIDLSIYNKLKEGAEKKLASTIDMINRREEAHTFSLEFHDVFKLQLKSNDKFLAIVNDQQNNPMVYKIDRSEKRLVLSFPNLKQEELDKIKIEAISFYISGLHGERALEPKVSHLDFRRIGNRFFADIQNSNEGVYSLKIQANVEDIYRRDLVTGFVVDKNNSNIQKKETSKADQLFTLYPNPIQIGARLKAKYPIQGDIVLKLYANDIIVYGVTKHIDDKTTEIEIDDINGLTQKGTIYTLKVIYNNHTQSIRIMK